jgi:hypothetical protein
VTGETVESLNHTVWAGEVDGDRYEVDVLLDTEAGSGWTYNVFEDGTAAAVGGDVERAGHHAWLSDDDCVAIVREAIAQDAE